MYFFDRHEIWDVSFEVLLKVLQRHTKRTFCVTVNDTYIRGPIHYYFFNWMINQVHFNNFCF